MECDNIVVCKNQGKHLARIFNDYNLKYKVHEQVLNSGGSGKAIKLKFERKRNNKKYKGTAILKMATGEITDKADNLFREGLVGMKMNFLSEVFPCFIRTLGLMKETPAGPFTIAGTKFKQFEQYPTIAEACKSYGKQALMLEFVDGKQFKEQYKTTEFKHELLPVLFQIYYALQVLGSRYTHFDLHTGNVLLTRPDKNACVAFEYTFPNGQLVRFKCSYVAKIIDYGRNYLDLVGSEVKDIENQQECNNKRCGHFGNKCGFRNYQNPKHPGLGYRRSNISHDLRLLNYAVKFLKREKRWKGGNVVFHEGEFSTEEISESGLEHGDINNVIDAGMQLAGMVNNNDHHFTGVRVLGTLKVDGVNPWKFIMTGSTNSNQYSSYVSSPMRPQRKTQNSFKNTNPLPLPNELTGQVGGVMKGQTFQKRNFPKFRKRTRKRYVARHF